MAWVHLKPQQAKLVKMFCNSLEVKFDTQECDGGIIVNFNDDDLTAEKYQKVNQFLSELY